MNKKILIIGIMIGALLLAGCAGKGPYGPWSSRGDRDPEYIPINEYRVGSDGIIIDFMDGLPPDRMTSQDSLTAMVEVKNIGATDVEYGKVILQSTDSNVIVQPEVQEFGIKGKNRYFLDGEMYNSEHLVTIQGKRDGMTSLVAYACYPYETILVDTLCVDPTVGKAVIVDKACEMRGKSFKHQGAPVAVTGADIQPIIQGDIVKLRINISVRNVGGGKVVSGDISSAECTLNGYDLKQTPNDWVTADVELADGHLTCTTKLEDLNTKGKLRGEIECTSGPITKQAATNSPFVVELYYGYITEKLIKHIEIID